MNRLMATILWLGLVLAPAGAWAQPAPGGQERPLVDRIASLRLELERQDKAMVALEQQRDRMARDLEQLAGEIARLKARRAQNPLLPEISLPNKLRRSQELSSTLTVLDRELEALTRIRRDKLQSLALSYDDLVTQTLAQARSAEGERRKDLLRLLGQARRDREAIRQELLPQKRSFQSFQPAELLASDDPDELSERADAIRDRQDRLRKELAQLDRRIAEVKAERRLDREMRDFITDQEIFDEGSRIMVVPRGPAAEAVGDPKDERKDEYAEPPDNGDPSGLADDGSWGGGEGDVLAGGVGASGPAGPDADSQSPLGAAEPDARQALGVDGANEPTDRIQDRSSLAGLKRKRGEVLEDLGKLDSLLVKVEQKIRHLSEP